MIKVIGRYATHQDDCRWKIRDCGQCWQRVLSMVCYGSYFNHALTINSSIRLISDLSRMYKLFSRVPEGLNEMRSYIKNYVLELGGLINAKVDNTNEASKKDKDGGDNEKPASNTSGSLYTALRWVQDILELQEKFDKIIEFAVLKDKSFQTAINEVSRLFYFWSMLVLVLCNNRSIPI